MTEKSTVPFWDGWWTRFKRRFHEDAFLDSLDETTQFQQLIMQEDCLACRQKTLELQEYHRTSHGWEATIVCRNCHFNGIVNSDGHDLYAVNSKGKARET